MTVKVTQKDSRLGLLLGVLSAGQGFTDTHGHLYVRLLAKGDTPDKETRCLRLTPPAYMGVAYLRNNISVHPANINIEWESK